MLREMILSGKFKPGTYLPSMRKLAEELEVTKSTVHVIASMLQKEGLVQIQPGRRGVMVVDCNARKNALRHIFLRSNEMGWFDKSPENIKMLGALCYAAEKRNIELTISFSDSINIINDIADLHGKDIIQGVIYMECSDEEATKRLERLNIPYVVMNDDSVSIDYVKCILDFRAVAREAVYYLFRRGHRQIGIINGASDSYLYAEFEAGFRGALAEDRLEYNQDWNLCVDFYGNKADGINKIANLLKNTKRPTAFFAARDYRASMLYEACSIAGLRIPEDVSVISYDDLSWPEGAGRGLTTFSQPVYEIGEAAVEMLQEWIATGEKVKNRKLETALIERVSVCDLK